MTSLFGVAGLLARGGSQAERTRRRLMATGAALATWFLFGGANVLALRGHLDQRLGPDSDPGTRGGTAFALGLLVLPVAAFLYQSTRLASADRERRLSALRLAGATPSQVRLLGALETTRAAVIGTVIGAATYLLLQWAGRRLLLSPRSHADVNVPPPLCAAAMAIVIVAAAVSGLLAGRHVVATPLSVTVRANRGRPRWYAIPLLMVPGLLPTLQATGTPETALRRVLIRQALIAATPVCAVAALAGLLSLGVVMRLGIWYLWPFPRALVLAGLGVLAAVLSAVFSRRRLRRTVTPALLRTE